jgi:hypothetical protein
MKQVFYSFALALAFLLMISPLVAPRLGPAGENWGWGWGFLGGAFFFYLLSQAWFVTS